MRTLTFPSVTVPTSSRNRPLWSPVPRGAVNWERGLSADALEALVGAMHLDSGFEAARRFVEWVLDDAASVGAAHIDGNYKVSRARAAGPGIPTAGFAWDARSQSNT